jgi:hypothetical protein
MKYIKLEPEWEGLLKWHCEAMITHSFEYGAMSPMISLIEQVVHLHGKNPRALERIVESLKMREARYEKKLGTGSIS